MKNRLIALLLVLIMCIGVFAGCQSSALRSRSEDEEALGNDAENVESTGYFLAFESYDPDTVMLTINGYDVTWQELFYWYHYDVMTIESYFGEITDWDSPSAFDETVSYIDYIKEDALIRAQYHRAIDTKCDELGISLSSQVLAEIDATWQSNVDSLGGDEAAFIEEIKADFLTKELIYYFIETNAKYIELTEEICGANGEKLDEEDVIAKALEQGYVRAKHILLSTVGDNDEPLPEEEQAKKLETALDLLLELEAISDPELLEAKMDELSLEYNDDPGVAVYTEGYTFGPNKMAAEFEAAAFILGDYELSGIIETQFGYHIILRLPLKATAAVEYYSQDSYQSLAAAIAPIIFDTLLEGWALESKTDYSTEYEQMNLAEILSKAK